MSDDYCPNCGAALPEQAPEQLCPPCTVKAVMGVEEEGDVIGPEIQGLTVHEEVGEGGFGIVYLATQTGKFQRRVALKVLKAGLDTRAVLRRFEVEQQALALLDHPNIARIHDAGETEKGYPFFTMEYIEGFPITDALEGKSLKTILGTALKVCDAISHAHEKGVIHRDLKPSNILVTATGSPKVIDFGIAKATKPEMTPGMTVYTHAGGLMGTPDYMAPEQMEGSLEVDERTDLFSLGVILKELLGDGAPRDLLRVAEKASAKKSGERYETVAEFAAELRRYLEGDRVKVPGRWKGVAIVGLGLVIGAIILGGFHQMKKSPAQEVVKDEIIFYSSDGGVMTPIIREDGKRGLVVFRDGGPCLLLNPATGEKISEVPPRPSAIRAAAFSEDGTCFVVGYYHGRIRWFNSETGEALGGFVDVGPEFKNTVGLVRHFTIAGEKKPTLFTQVGQETVLRAWDEEGRERWQNKLGRAAWGFAVRPDRTLGVIGSGNNSLSVIDFRKGKRIALIEGHGKPTTGLTWTPDGKFFFNSCLNGVIRKFDASGQLLHEWKPSERCEGLTLSPDGKFLASAGYDAVLRLWEVSTGELVREFFTEGAVWNSAFSPDGSMIAATGYDSRVRVWEVASGKDVIEPWVMEKKTFRVKFAEREGGGLYLIAGTSNDGVRFRAIER